MKKFCVSALLLLCSVSAWAQFTAGQVLTAAELNSQFALYAPLGGATFTGPVTTPTLTVSGSVALPSGSVSLPSLASQAANTVLANVTSSSASPAAFTMPSCSTSSSALNYTLGSGWSCNTSINASLLGGNAASTYAPLASPALTGTPTAPTATAGTNTTQLATTAFAQNAVTGGSNAGSFTTLHATGTSTLAGVTATSMTNSGLTSNSFVYSGASGLVSSTAAPTNGQVLIGSTGAAPVAATLTGTANQISIANGAGSVIFSLPSSLAIPGVVSSVNNVSAASTCNGVPVIVADTLNTFANEGANIPQTTIYTIPAGQGGRYKLTGKTVVTTPASGGTPSSTLPNMTVFATDEDSGGAISGNMGSTSTGNTTAAWATGSLQFDAAASTNIQVQTNSYATAGTTSMKYKARFVLEYMCQ